MKVGDLVKYYDGLNDDPRPGLVLEIVNHPYRGVPSLRGTYRTDIVVLWQDGVRMILEPDELRVVNESR